MGSVYDKDTLIRSTSFRSRLSAHVLKLLRREGVGVLLALLLLCGTFSILSPYFLTMENWRNIATQSAVPLITATGMTLVIASAGIDLSVGSIIALTGVVMAIAVQRGIPAFPSMLIGLASGALVGTVNGFFVGRARINPFIVTFAMEAVARAVALILTGAKPIYGFPPLMRWGGIGAVGPIPAPFILAFLIAAVAFVILEYTEFGRHVLGVGGNEEAARLYGIRVASTKIAVYALAGVTYAVAAIIVTARLNTAEPIAGYLAEMDAIAAAVIGGTALVGGIATVPGTIIGALIITILRNGLTLLSVQPYFQQLTIGVVIVAAVFLDRIRSR